MHFVVRTTLGSPRELEYTELTVLKIDENGIGDFIIKIRKTCTVLGQIISIVKLSSPILFLGIKWD